MKLFQLLFIFLVAPAFTNGIKCGYGGICYGNGMDISPFPLVTKDCADACIAFKCMTNSFMVMEGAGCYEDFDKACKSTATNLKDEIKANIGNYDIVNKSLEFHSCDTSDNCATNKTLDPWKIHASDGSSFGQGYFQSPYENLTCEFDAEPKVFRETVQCKTLKSCESAKEYDIGGGYIKAINGPAKSCPACVRYECTNDAGKTINLGYGCYEDFEAACSTVPSDVKENIKKNINDSLYYDENQYKVYTCRDEDNCHVWSLGLYNYDAVNQFGLNVDKKYDGKCVADEPSSDSPIAPTLAVPTPASSKPGPEIQSTEAPILSPIDDATSDSTPKPTDPTGGATLNEFGMKFFGLILLSFFIGF